MPTISEPSPSILALTLASNRSRAIPRTDSLTRTPTRRRTKGATQTSGRCPAVAPDPRSGVDGRRVDEVWRDLDASDQIAAGYDLAIELREHLERVDPIE